MSASGTLTHTYTYVADASHQQSDALTPTTHRRERRTDRNGDAMRGTKRCPPSGRKWAHTLRGRRKEREREKERERTRTNYSYLHRLLFLCYEDNNYQLTEEQQRSEAPFLSPPFPLPYSMCTLTSTEIYVSIHRYELGGRRMR